MPCLSKNKICLNNLKSYELLRDIRPFTAGPRGIPPPPPLVSSTLKTMERPSKCKKIKSFPWSFTTQCNLSGGITSQGMNVLADNCS